MRRRTDRRGLVGWCGARVRDRRGRESGFPLLREGGGNAWALVGVEGRGEVDRGASDEERYGVARERERERGEEWRVA